MVPKRLLLMFYLVQKVKFQIVHQVCRAGLLAAYFKMQNFPHTPPSSPPPHGLPPPPSPPSPPPPPPIPRAFFSSF